MAKQGLDKDGGISFTRKRNFGKDEEEEKEEPKEIEPEPEPEPERDVIALARQERLLKKYNTAKTVNYSGFAVNGGSVVALLYGVNNIIGDPQTLESLNMFNEIFKTEIEWEKLISLVEQWKAQLIGMCIGVQTFFAYYQDICSKLKEQDREDVWALINEELGKVM